ncbi:MAG: nucleotidyl transferase AbiEii/AbiGii toxin family protein [Anaerolineales bacterium]|nr:MAG: nucleotidyl transferase AbiEii/AbiGii toxin family protein [Anaerolineales bacterium]
MTALFWETISGDMRVVLDGFFRTAIGSRFYLAGWTALALQLGHRRSVDLDFFSPTEDIPAIRAALEESLSAYRPVLADSAWGNLVYLAGDVRMGFYGYGLPLVRPPAEMENLRLASMEDIALMKLDALLSRAARKDFYDLYFICQKIPLRNVLALAPQKYENVRDFEVQTVKRLIYFEHAEADIDPVLLQPVSWRAVKEYFMEQAQEIGTGWLQG